MGAPARGAIRRYLLVVAAAFPLVLPAPAVAGETFQAPSILAAPNAVEDATIARINDVRRALGLEPLTVSQRLARAAEAHAVSMGQGGFFSHTSADGTSFWKRIARYYRFKGFASWTVGENLLWASPGVTPDEAVVMWLESPAHRKVLLSPRWSQIGLAAVLVTNAPGVFGGLDVTIIAADFGSRS